MKKNYISPNMVVVKMQITKNMLIGASNTQANTDAEVAAPGMLNDDEIFQLFLIH